jgi:hypothetical protein
MRQTVKQPSEGGSWQRVANIVKKTTGWISQQAVEAVLRVDQMVRAAQRVRRPDSEIIRHLLKISANLWDE